MKMLSSAEVESTLIIFQDKSLMIFCLSIFVHSTWSQTCFDPNLLNNVTAIQTGFKLDTPPFRIKQTSGLMNCYKQCGVHSLCRSVNFNTISFQCELNHMSSGSMLVNTEHIFMRIEPWTLEILKSCKDRACPNNSVCVEEGNSFRCVLVGCSGVPEVEHVNVSAFLIKPLWNFDEQVRYPCLPGHFPDKNVSCSSNGKWTKWRCFSIKGCSTIFQCEPSLDENEYWLYSLELSSWLRAYCSKTNMIAFLTLHSNNLASTPALIKNPNSCRRKHGDPKLHGEMGYTNFFKVRLSVYTASIVVNKFLFAETNFTRQNFGSAGDCYSENTTTVCPAIGHFVINTSQTGLRVKSSTTWIPKSTGGRVDKVTRSADGLIIEGYCGADQRIYGGCQTESRTIQLELDPNYTPPTNSAIWVSCPHSPLP